MARLLALPVLVVVLTRAEGPTDMVAAWLFAAIGITDLLDGFLARRLKAETGFGRLADPLADRLLVAVGLVGLVMLDRFPAVGPMIILGRDALSVAGATALSGRGLNLPVDVLGKTSSALVMASVALALLSTATWIDVLFWGAVALSILTFALYVRRTLMTLNADDREGSTHT